MRERLDLPKRSTPGDAHLTEIQGQKYDVYRLIEAAKELPIIEVSVEKLFAEIVDGFYWADLEGRNISVREVCDSIMRTDGGIDWQATAHAHPSFVEHLRKIHDADYTHPVLSVAGLGIVDGIHRISKAHIDGRTTIPVRQFHTAPAVAMYREPGTPSSFNVRRD